FFPHFFFFLYYSSAHLHLSSFPPRRSSDLGRNYIQSVRYLFLHRRLAAGCGSSGGLLGIRLGHAYRMQDDQLGAAFASTGKEQLDRKSTRLNSSHVAISYAVFCLKKKKKQI